MKRPLRLDRVTLALLLLLPLLVAAMFWPARGAESEAAVSVQVAPPAALVEASTGAATVSMQAVGEGAEIINASLPFAGGPNPAAAAFAVNDSGTSYDRAHLCLTQAIYYEAGYEPEQGRRAVAQVVLNRVRHPAFPASVCGVVYEGAKRPVCQFSFTCDGSLDRRPGSGWARAKAIAAEMLGGAVEASVGTATHYHADYVAPYWAPKLAKTSKIGLHIFYRWPGRWGRPAAFHDRYAGEPRSIASLRRTAPPVRYGFDPVEEVVAVIEPPKPFVTKAEDPTIKRAENDVGGLVDVTKGWTPSIPDPTASRARDRVAYAQNYDAATPAAGGAQR